MTDGVLERLFESGRSSRAIAMQAGLPWQVVDAVITHCMPGDEARLPPVLIESLDRVLPQQRTRPNGTRPLVGTRADQPLLIVGTQPARILSWLAAHEPATGREVAEAVLKERAAGKWASTILQRKANDHGMLRVIEGRRPYQFTLTPLDWGRCAGEVGAMRPGL